MQYFTISIDGAPPSIKSQEFRDEVSIYNVDFMVLDRSSFIFGRATDDDIAKLYAKAKELGFDVDIERWC